LIKIHFIDSSGTEHQVEAKEGDSLMVAATNNLIPGIDAECGGAATCATCHVYIDDPTNLSEKSDVESMLLECIENFQDNSRLACQFEVRPEHGGLVVNVAPHM
jgi:2Fe-2S ferredoxin